MANTQILMITVMGFKAQVMIKCFPTISEVSYTQNSDGLNFSIYTTGHVTISLRGSRVYLPDVHTQDNICYTCS